VTTFAPVDLHTHSTASDGTAVPTEVVRLAHASGLSGIALTDHDTVAGIAQASSEAERLGIDFLSGIELSCSFPRPGTLHILGYGIDTRSPVLRKLIAEQSAGREERNRLILERLNTLGLDLHWDEVIEAAGGPGRAGSIGRPHLAALLVSRGHAASSRQAFDRYLGGGGAAYVDTNRLSAERAFATIRAAGGVASLAHPLQLRRQTWAQLEAMVRELSEQGLEAVETIHSGHDDETVAKLTRLADRLELLTTGGSDFHGSSKPGIRIGKPAGREVPRGLFDRIAARTQERTQGLGRNRGQSILCPAQEVVW
jgi:predicted metal-dependent phosphoesterase TrpH